MNEKLNQALRRPWGNGQFPWGPVVDIHVIGPYSIVEFQELGSNNHPTHPRKLTGRRLFSVYYIDDDVVRDAHESYGSLEIAMMGAICHRQNERHAVPYFARAIGLKEEQ